MLYGDPAPFDQVARWLGRVGVELRQFDPADSRDILSAPSTPSTEVIALPSSRYVGGAQPLSRSGSHYRRFQVPLVFIAGTVPAILCNRSYSRGCSAAQTPSLLPS